MPGWGSIAIGTRLEKMVESRFFTVWSQLIVNGLRPGDGFLIAADLPAHKASNELVRRFLQTGRETLLLLDSDADVDESFVEQFRMLEAGWSYDILQAFYCRRGWPPQAIWFQPEPETGRLVQCLVTADNVTDDVGAVGTHSVMIRREVFTRLLGDDDPAKHEWFWYPRGETISEDIAFSREAGAAGFRMGATTSVKAGHISRLTTGWTTYQEFVRINGLEAIAEAAYESSVSQAVQ